MPAFFVVMGVSVLFPSRARNDTHLCPLSICACVYACVRACARACVCVCVCCIRCAKALSAVPHERGCVDRVVIEVAALYRHLFSPRQSPKMFYFALHAAATVPLLVSAMVRVFYVPRSTVWLC